MKNRDTKKTNWGPGDTRKTVILFLILLWMSFNIWLITNGRILAPHFYHILAALFLLYCSDLYYSLVLSYKTSEGLKSFMLQTTIPAASMGLVTLLAFFEKIDSTTTITLFGISLGYTTYVVGKPMKDSTSEDNGTPAEEDSSP